MSATLPAEWAAPRWNAKAPVPCTKAMLIAWMAERHDIHIGAESRMGELVTLIENAYGERVPNTGGGAWPATWDCWDYIVKQEREIRGGQMRLIPKENVT